MVWQLVYFLFFLLLELTISKIVKIIIFLIVIFLVSHISVVLDFQFNLFIVDYLIVKFQCFNTVVCYSLFLSHDNVFQITNDFLLDLEIDFQFDILQLEDMVFDDHFEEVSVALKLDFLGYVLPNFLSVGHTFHQLQVSQLFCNDVLICAHPQSMDGLREGSNLICDSLRLLLILICLSLLQNQDLTLLPLNFKNVKGILFLDLHKCSPQLDSFVEVFEYLFLYFPHLFNLFSSSTRAVSNPILYVGIASLRLNLREIANRVSIA